MNKPSVHKPIVMAHIQIGNTRNYPWDAETIQSEAPLILHTADHDDSRVIESGCQATYLPIC